MACTGCGGGTTRPSAPSPTRPLPPAPRELLLRVPGFGVQTVDRLLAARRVRRLRHADLARLHVPLKKVLPFVEATDYRPGRALDAADLAAQLTPPPVQRSLF